MNLQKRLKTPKVWFVGNNMSSTNMSSQCALTYDDLVQQWEVANKPTKFSVFIPEHVQLECPVCNQQIIKHPRASASASGMCCDYVCIRSVCLFSQHI